MCLGHRLGAVVFALNHERPQNWKGGTVGAALI